MGRPDTTAEQGTIIQVQPDDYFSPGNSLLFASAASLAMLGVIAWAGLAWLRYARNARRARSSLDPDYELVEGPAIIAGAVQHAATSDLAVRVEIDQEASEKENSGSWSHRWTEVDRRVKVAPFYLERTSGERIRIHCTEKVFLVDDLDGCIFVDKLRRTRSAELISGEQVIAKGVLRRDLDPEGQPHGYRDVPMGWILVAPKYGPMHLSSKPLEARFVRWQRFHRNSAALLVVVLAAIQLILLTYHKRLFGETAIAQVLSTRHYTTTDDDGDDVHHWEVVSVMPWGERYTGEIEAREWRRLESGSLVPVRHNQRNYPQYGSSAQIHFIAGLSALGIALFVVFMYAGAIKRKRPWYSANVVDRGDGRIDAQTGLDRSE